MEHDVSAIKANSSPADPRRIEDEREEAEKKAEITKIHLDGLKDFYFLRRTWSWAIFGFITTLILFHIVLTGCIGFGYMDFKEYPWFISIVVTENFAQIIALALIVVKFLFHKKDNSANC
jgi:hypothetical protein